MNLTLGRASRLLVFDVVLVSDPEGLDWNGILDALDERAGRGTVYQDYHLGQNHTLKSVLRYYLDKGYLVFEEGRYRHFSGGPFLRGEAKALREMYPR